MGVVVIGWVELYETQQKCCGKITIRSTGKGATDDHLFVIIVSFMGKPIPLDCTHLNPTQPMVRSIVSPALRNVPETEVAYSYSLVLVVFLAALAVFASPCPPPTP